MKTNTTQLRRENAHRIGELRRANEELYHCTRALAHDMNANHFLLESAFRELKRALGKSLPAELTQPTAHVEACLRQSRRFLADLSELGRSGSIPAEPGRVDLNALVDEIVLEQRELLAARQIEVVVERPLPLLWCHADRLKQIVANLLGNAARHGCDPRKPRITIAARPAQSPEARMASFQIHDNGLGIEPRFRSEIFAPGWRVPGTAVEGTGMGLAIVKRMVEQYGGRVHLDSACTEGTCFVVALPAAAAESVPEATTSEEPRPAGRAWKSSRRRLNSF